LKRRRKYKLNKISSHFSPPLRDFSGGIEGIDVAAGFYGAEHFPISVEDFWRFLGNL
jgi:hypothetical protein